MKLEVSEYHEAIVKTKDDSYAHGESGELKIPKVAGKCLSDDEHSVRGYAAEHGWTGNLP